VLTSILIFLPIAGALFVWIAPWPTPRAAGGTALLIALAELVVWVNRALNFDYSNPGLQDEASHSWFSDLGVSYTVGLYDFSLWLVGLTVIVSTAAIAYGFWAGRERSCSSWKGRPWGSSRPRTCSSSTSSGKR
jgi:NADH-quinone oxidoreductase subunit M